MTGTRLENIEACVFDAYGTLFDFNSAAHSERDRLGDNADAFSALWRTKQLEYTWLRTCMGKHKDFWGVTGDALDYALDTFGLQDADLRERLMNLYLKLDAFPEVPQVLKDLKAAGIKTAILSNGEPKMLGSAVRNSGIGDDLDAVLSVERTGVYKPHFSVYQMTCDELDVPAERISFQSSNAWDAVAAATFGMKVIWCNRYGQRRERLTAVPDAEITDLSQMLPILGIG